VYLLGRYRKSPSLNLDEIRKQHQGLVIEYHTIHSSKGLEADYVIILSINGGVKGFPCMIEDDPLLGLVLSKPEDFPNAEERRLFYVALTRARKGVYLLSDFQNPSDFIEEILKGRYEINVDNNSVESFDCPNCLSGKLILRDGIYSPYYRCSNHPLCSYSINADAMHRKQEIKSRSNHYL